MFIIKYYVLLAAALILAAIYVPWIPLKLVLGWASISLVLVSIAYIFRIPRIFRKKQDGSIPFYIRWLFVPFLLGAQFYNHWSRKHDKVPAIQKIDEDLYLACRLFPSDIDTLKHLNINSILDVTAEFDGLDWTATSENLNYLNIPTLDHQSPTKQNLVEAINWINNHRQPGKGVVIHCALGRGRSVLVMAAYLLSKAADVSVEEVLQDIQHTRSTAALNKHQMKKLKQLHENGIFRQQKTLGIVANPVAGGGKWCENKDDIIQRLSSHYQLMVYETTEQQDGKVLGQQAFEDGADSLLACGGDGTITEVASIALEHQLPLGIMPMGTANALGHALYGTSSKFIPVDVACDAIVEGLTKNIDTATCNDELMLLVAAVGFEQKMIAQADRQQKDDGGQLAYVEALVDAVNANQASELTVKFDDQPEQKLHTASLVVANAAPFTTILAQGGGEPDFADGQLDVTWLNNNENASEQMLNLFKLAIGWRSEGEVSADIQHQRVSKIEIRSDDDLHYVVDGENRCADTIQISVMPASLCVYVTPY